MVISLRKSICNPHQVFVDRGRHLYVDFTNLSMASNKHQDHGSKSSFLPSMNLALNNLGLIILSSLRYLEILLQSSCYIEGINFDAKKFSNQVGVKIVVAYGGATIAHQYLALDETDRMLDMGFEPQICKIVERMNMPLPGSRQTMLLSATFQSRLASDFLSNYIFLTVGRVGSSTDLISQKADYVQEVDKRSHLMQILHAKLAYEICGKVALTLGFVETENGADALEYWLSMNGFPAMTIHDTKSLKSFKNGTTPILVATNVASSGLDIPHVVHVINFDLPKDIDDYVQIGRTGREGKSCLACFLLVGHGKRYGANRFGDYDYRNAQSGSENYNYSSNYEGPDSSFCCFCRFLLWCF
ncbi:hypothetical protein UlMin_003069 [Ulmus minor]